MTQRDFISQIRATHRLLSADNTLNDRSVLRESRNTVLQMVKRETDKRKLFASPNLFTVLPCLEMKQVPLTECCDYTSPMTISRSTLPIPKIAEGIYGLVVQKCTSVDNRRSFKETTPFRYANTLKLGLNNRDIFFWVYNDFLWITDPDIEAVNLSAFFEEDIPQSLLYPAQCECVSSVDPCLNPLDQPFRCPGYLLSTVAALVSKKLLDTYHRLPEDSLDDGMDGTTKNV